MSPFLTVWALVTGAAAFGTFTLSAATYFRVRQQRVPGKDLDSAPER
jgi:hypothetical protein